METVFEIIKQFCEMNKVCFERLPGEPVGRITLRGANHLYICFIKLEEEEHKLSTCTFLPLNIPHSQRHLTAELIVRINTELFLGCFDYSISKGKVAYKTTAILGTAPVHADIIKHLLQANWFAVDRYFPAFCAVVFGKVSPARALASVKNATPAPPKNKNVAKRPETVNRHIRNIAHGSLN
jgi:hypothetical protein